MDSSNKSELILKGLQSIYPIGHDFERKGLYTLSTAFTYQKVERGYQLWAEGLDQANLYFIVSGACGEYLRHDGEESLIRFYQKDKFAFSEDILIYSVPSETRCTTLTDSVIASIPKQILLDETLHKIVGAKLLSILINLSMTEYRNTTYEMLQSNGTSRLKAAIGQSPNLLNIIPRKELADYLGLSRASLFRAFKSFGHEQ
jgi:CRP-like cAMP-binding protein